jgi:4-hydroxymandelate oxidase
MSGNPRPVCLTDFEPLARAKMSAIAYEYLAGGAADEITLHANREVFDRMRLMPRILLDVSKIDTRTTVLGEQLQTPIIVAPVAYHKLFHSDGELATAQGAGEAGVKMVLSSFSTVSVEEVAARAKTPLWFQLYVQPDRGFTRELVARAEAAGCRALCVTVDTPVGGCRNREERSGFCLPDGLSCPNLSALKSGTPMTGHRPGGRSIYSVLFDAKLSWKDIEWIRSFATVPVLLKGVLNPDDADKSVQVGAAGIIVSNHGSRNLDTLPATLDALPGVVDRVAGRIEVLLDGGIRRGTDVVKALALGAKAVLIGRPYIYGLAVSGAEGVTRVLEILRDEFEIAMALTGRTSVSQLDNSIFFDDPCRK